MVKDHSDSERGNPMPPNWLLFPIIFYMHHHPTDRITLTKAFVRPVVEHWLDEKLHYMKLHCRNNSLYEVVLIHRNIKDSDNYKCTTYESSSKFFFSL